MWLLNACSVTHAIAGLKFSFHLNSHMWPEAAMLDGVVPTGMGLVIANFLVQESSVLAAVHVGLIITFL